MRTRKKIAITKTRMKTAGMRAPFRGTEGGYTRRRKGLVRIGAVLLPPSPLSKYDYVCKSLKVGRLRPKVPLGGARKVVIRGGLGVRYDFLKELARRKMPGEMHWIWALSLL
jgi:hypothetical protein